MNPTADEPLPDRIGRYAILARLGAGGMGVVYKAHDPHLDRVVALKVPHFAGPPQERQRAAARFGREARAAARVLHPHVCPLFDVGEHEGQPFVVMAFVEGTSLAERLAQAGRLAVGEAVTIACQVLDGLAAVHALGVVHRDVKPGNVLLDGAGRAMLTDFGLARPEGGEGLTSDGVVVGTPAYMAPEQAAGRADLVGPWTDVYAVGVVLYQMLTGRLPFEGPPLAVLAAVTRDEPPAPRQFRPDLDADLEALVLRALRKAPAERPADARAFAAALARHAVPGPSSLPTAGATTEVRPAETAAELPPRRAWVARRLAWLAGAACVALGGALLAYVPFHVATEQSPSFEERVLLPAFLVSFAFGVPILLGLGVWALAEYAHVPEGLRSAAKRGFAWWVRRAVANGVPLDEPDELGETALMHAAAGGHAEVVKVLLLHGADVRARNVFGQSAGDVARARGHVAVVALLHEFEARGPTAPSPRAPAPRPRACAWLLGAALLGALAVVGFHWVYRPYPTDITFAEFIHLLEGKQVGYVELRGGWIVGTVRKPNEHAQLRDGWFSAPIPSGQVKSVAELVRAQDPTVGMSASVGSLYNARLPPDWVIAPMLALPLLAAALLGWPLGSAYWFPMLRPARPRPSPNPPTR